MQGASMEGVRVLSLSSEASLSESSSEKQGENIKKLLKVRQFKLSPRKLASEQRLLSNRPSKAGDVLGLSDVALLKEKSMERKRSGNILEEKTKSLLASTRRTHRFTPANMPLDMILNNEIHLQLFIMFSDSVFSSDALLFFLRVKEFKELDPERGDVIQSRAVNIWDNFLASNAERQVILAAPTFTATYEAIQSQNISTNLFDECQQQAYSIIAFSIFPQYLNFLNQSKESFANSPGPSPRDETSEGSLSESSFSFSGVRSNRRHNDENIEPDESLLNDTNSSSDLPQIKPEFSLNTFARVRSMSVDLGSAKREVNFSDTMRIPPERESFRVFLESINRTQYFAFLDALSGWNPENDTGLSIWAKFLSSNCPMPVLPSTSDCLFALKQKIASGKLDPLIFDEVHAEVLGVMEKTLFPEFLKFIKKGATHVKEKEKLRRSMSFSGYQLEADPEKETVQLMRGSQKSPRLIASDIPSLVDCLVIGTDEFKDFRKFTLDLSCEVYLEFWQSMCELEEIEAGEKDLIHAKAEKIFETFVASRFSEIKLSSSVVKEIQFDVENGLIRQDMFEGAKNEMKEVIASNVYPIYLLFKSNGNNSIAAPKLEAFAPELEGLLSLIERNKGRDKRNSMKFMNRLKKMPTDTAFLNHSFFKTPCSKLRLIVCSAFENSSTEKDIAEMRLTHNESGRFSIAALNCRKAEIAKVESIMQSEVMTVLDMFKHVFSNDYVFSYQYSGARRRRGSSSSHPPGDFEL